MGEICKLRNQFCSVCHSFFYNSKNLGGSHHHKKQNSNDDRFSEPSNELVSSIIDTGVTIDEKIEESELRLFSNSAPLRSSEMNLNLKNIKSDLVQDSETGRQRRKVVFDDEPELDQGKEFYRLAALS